MAGRDREDESLIHRGGPDDLSVVGKGNKERVLPLHPKARERLDAWLSAGGRRDASAS